MPTCHACGAPLPRTERIGRRETCVRCGADLHCCLNCRFYAPGLHNDCAENQAERVVDKASGNFCEYFSPGKAARPAPSSAGARAQLDSLFKKGTR